MNHHLTPEDAAIIRAQAERSNPALPLTQRVMHLADWRVTKQALAIAETRHHSPVAWSNRSLASFGMDDAQHRAFVEDCAR